MTDLILVVEDDPEIASLLKDYLEASNFATALIDDGALVTPFLQTKTPTLVLLDIMLPNVDGLSLCRQIKEKFEIPVILLTARSEEIDRLLGLELGADDYICKPFSPREVVARVKTVSKRYQKSTLKSVSLVEANEEQLRLAIDGQQVPLTAVEFQLFYLMYKEPGRVFSRNHIIDTIYKDYRVVNDRTVDSHIKKLRKKISTVYAQKELIHSVYGVGYRFEE